MGFWKRLVGGAGLDGDKLANSTDKAAYAQIDLLARFVDGRELHPAGERQRWNRVLPQPYDETIKLFIKQAWLEQRADRYLVTDKAKPFVDLYRARQARERAEVMPKARKALLERDSSEALSVRRAYEARQPLGEADWTGPEPQLSHSALTRRILFMNHWLLEKLSAQTVDWLKLYAAEQHLWGATWRLPAQEIPDYVKTELGTPEIDGAEAAYWRAHQLTLIVDNQETWQRCKGGDHVRRIEVVGPDDEYTCAVCKPFLGKQYLVARVPELPPRDCTSPRGCLCRYEPVLETYEDA